MNNSIQVENLVKTYKNVQAVQGTSFYVEQGTLFALLGENGAGKSTTINILSTLLQPDAGAVTIGGLRLGKQDKQIREKIGIVFQESMLDRLLTVQENLLVRGSFYGISSAALKQRIQSLSQSLELEEFLHRRYGQLSGGQRRRADIARALVNTPEILFLDEPTTGLDPASRQAIWELVQTLQKKAGTTVLLTTHYMEEAAEADYVVVMGHGNLLAKGTPPSLKTAFSHDSLRFEPHDMQAMCRELQRSALAFVQSGSELILSLTASTDALPLLERYGSGMKNFQVLQGSLDDAFITIINNGKKRSTAL